MIDAEFIRNLKLKTDDEVFDALYGCETLSDDDFKMFMTEAMLRLMGMVIHD